MEELKPCPFCGGVANIIDHHNDDGTVSVGCDNDTCLGFSGLGWLYSTEAAAVRAWNTRAERTCRIENTNGEWRCSCCGEAVGSDDPWCESFTNGNAIEMWNYCPNCGAKVVE